MANALEYEVGGTPIDWDQLAAANGALPSPPPRPAAQDGPSPQQIVALYQEHLGRSPSGEEIEGWISKRFGPDPFGQIPSSGEARLYKAKQAGQPPLLTYAPIAGFDPTKTANESYASAKYTPAFRQFSSYVGSGQAIGRGNLAGLVEDARQRGFPNAVAVGDDKIDYGDGYGPVDVINASAGDTLWFNNQPGPTVSPPAPTFAPAVLPNRFVPINAVGTGPRAAPVSPASASASGGDWNSGVSFDWGSASGGGALAGGRGPMGTMVPWDVPFVGPAWAGGEFQPPTTLTEANDPGYLERLRLGQQAIERSASARGTLLSGGTLKDLTDYAQTFASGEFDKVYGRARDKYDLSYGQWVTDYNRALQEYRQAYDIFNQQQGNQFNRLASLAGLGQSSAGVLGSQGLSSVSNMGDIYLRNAGLQGDLALQGGNAAAAGIVGGANAFTTGLGNVGQAFANWLANRRSGSSYSPPIGGAYPMGSSG